MRAPGSRRVPPTICVALLGALLTSAVACGLTSCGPRVVTPGPPHSARLLPPPPPPPGSLTVYGPLRIDTIRAARSEVGWDRDFVHGSRLVTYDVIFAQERATCPKDAVEPTFRDDAEDCRGVPTMPSSCKVEPVLRARVEVTVVHALDVQYRCAGEPAPFTFEGDPKSALSTQARACFQRRNKLKPEAAWTSLYELTELEVGEKVVDARSAFPRAIARLIGGESGRFCRDDGAYLDGTSGRAAGTKKTDAIEPQALASAIVTRVPPQPVEGASIPLTTPEFRTEHALWEQCNGAPARASLVARERCLLLRQLDRFLRDVEDLARPETPKGGGG